MQQKVRENNQVAIGQRLTLTFDSLDPSGRTRGQFQGIPVLAYDVLPGERADVTITKRRRGTLLAEVDTVIVPHPARRTVQEDHFPTCSPWQIMEYPYQAEIKQGWITAMIGKPQAFYSAAQEWGYRTKIEYGFIQHEGQLALSLRGHTTNILVPTGCKLASPTMNTAALEILLQLQQLTLEPSLLRSLVIRESKTTNTRIATLYIREVHNIPLRLKQLTSVQGLTIAVAVPNVSTGIPDQVLRQEGQGYLEETIAGLTIRYPFDAFWQNNMSLFPTALHDIHDLVPEHSTVAELYAGTGVIGLSLHNKNVSIQGYEHGESMVYAATQNAIRNGITDAAFTQLSDESFGLRHLLNVDGLIVDPPRKGLSNRVHEIIQIHPPEYIIYLGCNITTLAKDVERLKERYVVTHISGYDFYPNTPYVETLVKLERKK
ncbi:MAG: hypothetical protein WEC84_02425 [Candidatus Andersenbacteria bacterium]